MWTSICMPRPGLSRTTSTVRCLFRSLRPEAAFNCRHYTLPPVRLSLREDILADENADLLKHLQSRGLVHSLTSRSIRGHLNESPRSVYSGVDPSAASLHVGNLLPLLTLVHFARWGHNPIVLVGGATGSIGDPSGRATERNALDPETLQTNVAGITAQLQSIFSNVEKYYATIDESASELKTTEKSPTDTKLQQGASLGMRAILLNNHEWTSGLTLLDFLSTVGRQARMTTMLGRESVASRLNADNEDGKGQGSSIGMSFTEFSYQLLQANDFAHLHKTHSCSFQVGGSDQLGNIMAGIDLIRRTNIEFKTMPAYGLTTPLLTTSTGEKFGKSAGNAVWLDPEMTSDLDFYQFFLRTADEDAERYLMTLTLLPLQEIRSVVQECKLDRVARKSRKAQKLLAYHLTTLIRGADAAQKSESITQSLYKPYRIREPSQKAGALTSPSSDIDNVRNLDLSLLEAEPGLVVALSWDKIIKTHDITKLLVGLSMVKSRSEAKRLITSRAVYLNNQQVLASDPREVTDVLVRERHLLTSLRPLSQRPTKKENQFGGDKDSVEEEQNRAELPAGAGPGPQKFFDASVGPPKYFVLKLGKNGPQKIVKVVP